MDNFVLIAHPIVCSASTLRNRAIVTGDLLSMLGVNVFDAANLPVSGASIYAKRHSSEQASLGTLLGLTGSGTFSKHGYLKTYLAPGNYTLTAKYSSLNATAQDTVTLDAFELTNHELFLNKALPSNTPPSIVITAPTTHTTVLSDYTIKWHASDPDNKAKISLYYSMTTITTMAH